MNTITTTGTEPKLSPSMEECLLWLARSQSSSPYWNAADNGGWNWRTWGKLLELGLVGWNAFSPDTWGGYRLTDEGKELADKIGY